MSYPSPILNLDFVNSRQLGDKVAFSRASVARRRASNGNNLPLRTGMPVLEYNAVGEALGLRAETDATSRALWCRDMMQTAWACTGCTPLLDAVGIEGVANSATTLTAGSANATALQAITYASGVRCYSVHVKRKTGTGKIYITLDGGTSWTEITSSLSATAFYRAYISATVTNPHIGVKVETSGDAICLDFHQLEDGTFPTSEILTTTAAVSRAADVCSVDLTKLVGPSGEPLWNGVGGTIVVTADTYSVGAVWPTEVQIDDGTWDNKILLNFWTGTSPRREVAIDDAGVKQFYSSVNGVVSGTTYKTAFAFKPNDFRASFDGVLGAAVTVGSIPSVNALRIGPGLNGRIKQITIYNRRIADAYLPALSAL